MNEYQKFYLGVLKILRQSDSENAEKRMWPSECWEEKKKAPTHYVFL